MKKLSIAAAIVAAFRFFGPTHAEEESLWGFYVRADAGWSFIEKGSEGWQGLAGVRFGF